MTCMGYSHIWYRQRIIPDDVFNSILSDVKKIMTPLSHIGIPLANIEGNGVPDLTIEKIGFNGKIKCGHPSNNIKLVWPTKNATGIDTKNELDNKIINNHLITAINTRTCNGCCMHEPFIFEKVIHNVSKKSKNDMLRPFPYFRSCKTAFKPYDLVVTTALIIIKHHLMNNIHITSDGDDSKWKDGIMITTHFLGYGDKFTLDHKF